MNSVTMAMLTLLAAGGGVGAAAVSGGCAPLLGPLAPSCPLYAGYEVAFELEGDWDPQAARLAFAAVGWHVYWADDEGLRAGANYPPLEASARPTGGGWQLAVRHIDVETGLVPAADIAGVVEKQVRGDAATLATLLRSLQSAGGWQWLRAPMQADPIVLEA